MAYWIDTWMFRRSREIEIKFAGNYGAKGERRAPRAKATKEQIKKQNQLNKEKSIRRLIKANFEEEDYWITLKYPAGTRKPIGEAKTDVSKFLRKLRGKYRKQGEELKYIYKIEIGKRGGVHIHLLVNRISGRVGTDQLVSRLWREHGAVNYETTYDTGGYKKLADYIAKPPWDEDADPKECTAYSNSRNLIRPKPERRYLKRRTVRKMILDGIEPAKGYAVDKESVVIGINPYTGMSYIHYTEVLLDKPPEQKKGARDGTG